jgi:hypothetical protein
VSATTTTYTFDASQRLVRQQFGTTEVHYFTYNERNMLTQVQDYVVGGGGDTNRYFAYNGLGERVFGIDGTANPSYWTYDGKTLLSENVDGSMNQFRHNKGPQDATTGGNTECVTSDTTPVYSVTEAGGTVDEWTCHLTDAFETDAFGFVQAVIIGITGAPPVQRSQWRTGEGVLGTGMTQPTNLLAGAGAVLNGPSIPLVGAGGIGFLGSVTAGLSVAVGPGIFEDRRVAMPPPRRLDGWFVDATPGPVVLGGGDVQGKPPPPPPPPPTPPPPPPTPPVTGPGTGTAPVITPADARCDCTASSCTIAINWDRNYTLTEKAANPLMGGFFGSFKVHSATLTIVGTTPYTNLCHLHQKVTIKECPLATVGKGFKDAIETAAKAHRHPKYGDPYDSIVRDPTTDCVTSVQKNDYNNENRAQAGNAPNIDDHPEFDLLSVASGKDWILESRKFDANVSIEEAPAVTLDWGWEVVFTGRAVSTWTPYPK